MYSLKKAIIFRTISSPVSSEIKSTIVSTHVFQENICLFGTKSSGMVVTSISFNILQKEMWLVNGIKCVVLQEFLLPRGTNPEQISSTLSTDGVLTVEAPLPQLAIQQ